MHQILNRTDRMAILCELHMPESTADLQQYVLIQILMRHYKIGSVWLPISIWLELEM